MKKILLAGVIIIVGCADEPPPLSKEEVKAEMHRRSMEMQKYCTEKADRIYSKQTPLENPGTYLSNLRNICMDANGY